MGGTWTGRGAAGRMGGTASSWATNSKSAANGVLICLCSPAVIGVA